MRAGSPLRVLVYDLLCVVPYYTGYLCRALSREGVDVRLASVTYHLDPGWFGRVGVANHALLDGPRWFRPQHALFRKVWKLGEYLLNMTACAVSLLWRRPAVMHVQFLELILHRITIEVWLLHWVRWLGIRIVYTAHDVVPHDGEPVNRATLRRVYHLCDEIIAHDTTARDRLVGDFGVDPRRIRIIPHGPLFAEPPGTRQQERARLGVGPATCVVLCQGILRSYKGVPFLLDAWKELCHRRPDALLWIAGTGAPALVEEIQAKVRELGLEATVRLDMRFLSVPELQNALDAADVLAYPYREITTSGALMTGINYGKALLATRLPCFQQILRHEENALLVEYGDVAELASALRRLIDEPALRQRLGQALLRSEAQPMGWPEIAQRTIESYRAVTDGK